MNEGQKDIRQMQKFYRVTLTSLSDRLGFSKEGVHRMFKIGYHKTTTSGMSYDEWIEYLDNVHYFIQEVFGRYYDTDRYKNENISYYDMPYAMIDTFLFQ